jgi:hypothetical protein
MTLDSQAAPSYYGQDAEEAGMRVKEASTKPTGSVRGGPSGRGGLRWRDACTSAIVILVIAVPTMAVEEDWHGRPMIDQAGHLWLAAAFLVVVAFLTGGALAGYRRPSSPTIQAAAGAGLALAVLVVGAVARRLLIAHDGLPVDVAQLWCLAIVAAMLVSAVGSLIGRRLATG